MVSAIRALKVTADAVILERVPESTLYPIEMSDILDILPYPEAYEIAISVWEGNPEMDEFERFAYCLSRIGEERAITKLIELYSLEPETIETVNALEILSELYGVEVPGLS